MLLRTMSAVQLAHFVDILLRGSTVAGVTVLALLAETPLACSQSSA